MPYWPSSSRLAWRTGNSACVSGGATKKRKAASISYTSSCTVVGPAMPNALTKRRISASPKARHARLLSLFAASKLPHFLGVGEFFGLVQSMRSYEQYRCFVLSHASHR